MREEIGVQRLPELRFWVEFALYDRELGIAWVPVDLGKGGNDYRVGSLKDGESVVVLASNLWPRPIKAVGAYPCDERRGQKQRGPDGKLRRVIPGNRPGKGDDTGWCTLPAGLWGFWTEEDECKAAYQTLAFTARRKSVSGKSSEEK